MKTLISKVANRYECVCNYFAKKKSVKSICYSLLDRSLQNLYYNLTTLKALIYNGFS